LPGRQGSEGSGSVRRPPEIPVSTRQAISQEAAVDALYEEAQHWHVNTGNETIHAKRIGGRWRTVKWLTSAFWLVFFLGPYLR